MSENLVAVLVGCDGGSHVGEVDVRVDALAVQAQRLRHELDIARELAI